MIRIRYETPSGSTLGVTALDSSVGARDPQGLPGSGGQTPFGASGPSVCAHAHARRSAARMSIRGRPNEQEQAGCDGPIVVG